MSDTTKLIKHLQKLKESRKSTLSYTAPELMDELIRGFYREAEADLDVAITKMEMIERDGTVLQPNGDG